MEQEILDQSYYDQLDKDTVKQMEEQRINLKSLVIYFFMHGRKMPESEIILTEAYDLDPISNIINNSFLTFRDAGARSDDKILGLYYELLIYISLFNAQVFEDAISELYNIIKDTENFYFTIKDKKINFIDASHEILSYIDQEKNTKYAEIFYKTVIFGDNKVFVKIKKSDETDLSTYYNTPQYDSLRKIDVNFSSNMQKIIDNNGLIVDIINIDNMIDSILNKIENGKTDDSKVQVFSLDDVKKIEGNTLIPKLLEKGNYRSLYKVDSFLSSLDELRHDFPNMHDFIDFVEQNSLLNKLGNEAFQIPPSLLVGAPGIGKTFFLSSLFDKAKVSHSMIHMESLSGSFPLTGASPQWKEAKSGIVFNSIIESDYANGAIILDEVDKIMQGNYSPENSLLQFLEEHTAREFKDEFCPIKLDVSHINWLATANEIHNISTPMISRFNVFNIKMPNFEERKILAGVIYRSLLSKKTWGHAFSSNIADTVLDKICTSDNSIRNMKKDLLFACGHAVKSGRRELHLEDFTNLKIENQKTVGF